MNKKTKKQLLQVAFVILLVFLGWLLISFNIIPAETASELTVKNHDAAVKFVANVTDNIVFYAFAALVASVSYYFLRYKK